MFIKNHRVYLVLGGPRVHGFVTIKTSTSHILFLYASHSKRDVAGWRRFSSAQGTNISQSGQQGWGRFPSSIITTVSCTWRCMKWKRRLAHVVVRPSQPPSGHPMVPAALGKDTLYILGSGKVNGVYHLGGCYSPCWAWKWSASDHATTPSHTMDTGLFTTISPERMVPCPSSTAYTPPTSFRKQCGRDDTTSQLFC